DARPVMAARQTQIRPPAMQQAARRRVARDRHRTVAAATADPAFLQPAQHAPAPRLRCLLDAWRKPLQLNIRDRQGSIAEMKEAELEATGIGALDAVSGRHLEDQRTAASLQLGRGEILPAPLKATQHDNFEAEHRLPGHARRTGLAPEAQPVTPLRQVEIGAIKNAAGWLAAANPGRAVSQPRADRGALKTRQQRPAGRPHLRRARVE